jgi:hypothetical protein
MHTSGSGLWLKPSEIPPSCLACQYKRGRNIELPKQIFVVELFDFRFKRAGLTPGAAACHGPSVLCAAGVFEATTIHASEGMEEAGSRLCSIHCHNSSHVRLGSHIIYVNSVSQKFCSWFLELPAFKKYNLLGTNGSCL